LRWIARKGSCKAISLANTASSCAFTPVFDIPGIVVPPVRFMPRARQASGQHLPKKRARRRAPLLGEPFDCLKCARINTSRNRLALLPVGRI